MLCSKCSSVCNEKGENVKENARKEKEGRGGEKEEERKLKANRPSSSVSSSTSDNRRSCKAPASPTKGKVVLQKASRVKRDSGAPLKPSIENCPVPILDLDKLQYARTKARATSNCLVPKVKRLRIPGMIQAAESTPEPETVTPSSSQETSDPTITSSRVSSSTAVPPDSMQPLKIRFAHKQSSRNSSRQYSIVKDEDSDSSDQQKENIDNESEDSEVEKRKSDHGLSEAEEGENQPLKKVFKKDSVGADPMIGACRVVPQSAPVLKISFGKESTVLQLPPPAQAAALKVRVAL